jgi:hypothetical protein
MIEIQSDQSSKALSGANRTGLFFAGTAPFDASSSI